MYVELIKTKHWSEIMLQRFFVAPTNMEKGRLRLSVITFSIVTISILNIFLSPSRFININLLASILVLNRIRFGVLLYKINIVVAGCGFLINIFFMLITGVIDALGINTTQYFLITLLVLIPAVYNIKKDTMIRTYFFGDH